jgi:hypothetical protein
MPQRPLIAGRLDLLDNKRSGTNQARNNEELLEHCPTPNGLPRAKRSERPEQPNRKYSAKRNHRNAGRPGARPLEGNDEWPRSAVCADKGPRHSWG